MRFSFIAYASVILTLGFVQFVRSDDTTKPDIDLNRAREIYERQQKGEKVSAEDQAYLKKVIAEKKSEQPNTQAGKPGADGIDWEKAKAIYQREQAGEKLSADDQAYLDKAKSSRNRGRGDNPGGQAGQPAAGSGIDWERAKALYQREQAGEKLSADDQAYLDKAKATRNGGGQRPATRPAGGANPAAGAGIDWNRAKAIHQKQESGEKLSDDDQAYLEKARAALQAGARPENK